MILLLSFHARPVSLLLKYCFNVHVIESGESTYPCLTPLIISQKEHLILRSFGEYLISGVGVCTKGNLIIYFKIVQRGLFLSSGQHCENLFRK